jgi:hypothetical protein
MDRWASWVTLIAATGLQQLRLLVLHVSEPMQGAALHKGGGDILEEETCRAVTDKDTAGLQQPRLALCR